MLKPISDCGLSESDLIAARLLRGWCALDTETGAFMYRTSGRGKGGLSKYVLILPNKTPAERGGLLARYDWNEEDRKFIRAWTDAAALEAANVKLMKMIERRQQGAAQAAA